VKGNNGFLPVSGSFANMVEGTRFDPQQLAKSSLFPYTPMRILGRTLYTEYTQFFRLIFSTLFKPISSVSLIMEDTEPDKF
jgi:hypothetical protein